MAHEEKDVAEDRAAAYEMLRKTGQTGVPVILVNDEVVIGFDRPRLELLLAKRAEGKRSFGLGIADASRIAQRQGAVPVFGAFAGRVAVGGRASITFLRGPQTLQTEITF